MDFFNHLWQSAIVLSLFYIVYVLFLRKDTLFEAKRHYFLSGILIALFLPFVKITQTIYKEAPVLENLAVTNNFIAVTPSPITESVAEKSIDWTLVLLGVYLLGMLVFLVRLGIQCYSLLRLIRSYPVTRKGKYRFVQVNEQLSPFSFFNYIVYNPEMHSQEELEMILQHEKVHVSQWHSLDILLGNFIQIAQWINPFSWLYKKSMAENLEFIADGKTVTQVASKTQYQLTMVKASSSWAAPSLTIQFYQSFIKKRIVMLNKQHSKKRNALKAMIILPLLALFLWSFNVQEIIEYEEPETPTTEAESTTENEFIFSETEPEEPTVEETALLEEAEVESSERTVASDTIEPISKKSEMGDNPLYIINGKEVRRNEIPDNEINIQGEINVYYPEEAVEKFGAKGSEGVVVLKGNVNLRYLNEENPNSFIEKGAEFRFKIHKNTTDAELKQIKNELKQKHDIELSYNVDRNSKGEITSINMAYTGKGKSGSYSISEDDDNPIEEFEFYMNENGRSGFYSEAHEQKREERMAHRLKEMEKRNSERVARAEERHSKGYARRKDQLERRKRELEERRVERIEEMKDRQEAMEEEREEMMEERKIELEKRMREREKEMKEREVELREHRGRLARVGNQDNVFVYSDSNRSSHVIITKNTTDAELAQMKKDLAKEGVTFTYKRVKRNSQGEITSIKIEVKDGNGRSQTSIRSDTDNPIEDVIVEF